PKAAQQASRARLNAMVSSSAAACAPSATPAFPGPAAIRRESPAEPHNLLTCTMPLLVLATGDGSDRRRARPAAHPKRAADVLPGAGWQNGHWPSKIRGDVEAAIQTFCRSIAAQDAAAFVIARYDRVFIRRVSRAEAGDPVGQSVRRAEPGLSPER